ncbi:MAG TPA: hypothetical protein VF077_08995 [Nitrospiraceae bacterium]
MPHMSGLLGLVLQVIIAGLILWLLWWLVDFAGLPQPFNKVIKVIIAIIGVIYLIGLLTGVMPLRLT